MSSHVDELISDVVVWAAAILICMGLLTLVGCAGISLRPIQRDHAIRIAQVQEMLGTDAAHLSVAVSYTQQQCDELDGKVTGWTAGGAALGVLSGGAGVTAIFTEATPRYIIGAVGAGLAAFTAVSTYLATHYSQVYARRCAVNTGGQ